MCFFSMYRTMTFKDGVAYLQAGGGIVFDSVEEDEYVETINKLSANVRTIERAEGAPAFHRRPSLTGFAAHYASLAA
jgi:hypothetical protein